jgi:Domain of unknown function (DUF4432)
MLETWRHTISNPLQLGGIETSILDNGAGRGTRIAWINTGTGLRFKLVPDRAMDIADAFFNQHSLAWLSHLGITAPQPGLYRGIDWIKTFSGGLLVTCGLDHIGGPEQDAYGERGLHGSVSNMPASIVSVVQPDIRNGNLDMSITGIIKQTQPLGQQFELKRTIAATLGKAQIRIHDEVTNCGNTPVPHMLLYHFNLGWPLADEGSTILWQGKWTARETGATNKIFTPANNFHTCTAPLDDHCGGGEEAVFIDVDADPAGICICGLHNAALGLALTLKFQKKQLPWLTNWQHFGKGEYVTGLEPGTHPPIGQAAARAAQQLLFLEPGETKQYDLELDILYDAASIRQFTDAFQQQ